MEANQMHYFSDLFGKVLYMFRTDLLSISRNLNLKQGIFTCLLFLSYSCDKTEISKLSLTSL